MSKSDSSPSPELLRLISGLIDGQLSAPDHRRLCELLRDDVEAQAEYHRILSVHALLEFDLVLASPLNLPKRSLDYDAEAGKPAALRFAWRRLETRWRAALIVGAGLAACLFVLFTQGRSHKDEHTLVAEADGELGTHSPSDAGMPPVCLVVFRKEANSSPSTDQPQSLEEVKSGLSVNQMADIVTFMKERGVSAKSFEGNHPKHVRQQEDGSVTLNAKTAQIYGRTLVFEEKFGNLGFWSSSDDWALWKFSTKTAVTFDVVVDYACQDVNANNPFVLAIDDEQISGTVAGTGTWDDYRQVVVGQIRLEPGNHRLVFRSTDELKEYLVDLRSVILRPSTPRPPSTQSMQ